MSCNSKDVKFPLTIDELKQQNFPTVYAKVSGFLIARTIDRYTKRETDYIKVRLSRKKNTIVGIPNLINAFQTYMGNTAYTGSKATPTGIILTTTQGQEITLSFAYPPIVSANNSGATMIFVANDNSTSSYAASSEQLNTQSAGNTIELATNSVPITKQSNETLSITWLINIDISISGQLTYIPTSSPQSGGLNCYSITTGCDLCANLSYYIYGCQNSGLSNQYPNINFVTTQLFTDMFYNSYSQGGSSSFIATTSNTIYIYSSYCFPYFFIGIANNQADYIDYSPKSNGGCFLNIWPANFNSISPNPIYVQLYYPQQPANYIGVQVVYST